MLGSPAWSLLSAELGRPAQPERVDGESLLVGFAGCDGILKKDTSNSLVRLLDRCV